MKGDKMGFKLKEMREKKRLSQEELAIKSGVSRSYISQLENGQIVNTTTDTLRKLAQALNCKISDIFFTGKV